jgi:hypothetical protein
MDRDPYDTSLNWIPQQFPESRRPSAYTPSAQPAQNQTQKAPTTTSAKQARKPNMPKQQALALVRNLKKGIVASSIIGFAFFGGLAANHAVNTTTNQTISSPASTSSSTPTTTMPATTPSTTSSSSSPAATPSATSNSSSSTTNGGFFNQQNGGSAFGSSGSSQGPVSGTGVS